MLNKKYILPLAVILLAVFFIGVTGCKKSFSEGELIQLNLSDATWNASFAGSSGTIEVFLHGVEVEKVDLSSIMMRGDNPAASPLPPVSSNIQGNSVVAAFLKNQVFGLLLNPAKGSTHRITVTFRISGSSEPMELQADVTIDDGSDEGVDVSALTLEIDPAVWSMNYPKSSGTVEAFIRGEGLDKIDLNSFYMIGDNSSAQPLAAASASINNNQIHARFAKSQVLDILLNPAPGSVHTITIRFNVSESGQQLELTAVITIEDDEDENGIDPSDLTLEIDPSEWNMNYSKSSGTVEAFIRGDGIDQIDLNSIQMMGDNSSAQPLNASSVSINNNQIHARFPKNRVLDLLLNPEPGSTHTITILFTDKDTGEQFELSADITIEDDEDDGEINPSDLRLEIVPQQWNLNYSKSSGQVKAFIRGQGIEKIDLDTIELSGDNAGASPLAAVSAKLSGNHIQAEFPKNKVLDLLLNPTDGSTHTVTVRFKATGGGAQMELSTTVSITGK